MGTTTKAEVSGKNAQIVTGIQKYLLSLASIPLAGTTFTGPDLITLIQSQATQAAKVAAAAAAWHGEVGTEQELGQKLRPVLKGLRQYVINTYGATSPVLADFGYTAAVRKPLDPTAKVAAAAKAKATRAARHTMGSMQKQAVKGDVTGITVTTVTAGSPAAATAVSTSSSPTGAAPSPAPRPARRRARADRRRSDAQLGNGGAPRDEAALPCPARPSPRAPSGRIPASWRCDPWQSPSTGLGYTEGCCSPLRGNSRVCSWPEQRLGALRARAHTAPRRHRVRSAPGCNNASRSVPTAALLPHASSRYKERCTSRPPTGVSCRTAPGSSAPSGPNRSIG